MLLDDIEVPEDAELTEVSAPLWAAWATLSNDRPLGALGGAGRIPWSSIRRYAEDDLDDPDEANRLSRMLWAMDDVYLMHLNEQQKKQSKS